VIVPPRERVRRTRSAADTREHVLAVARELFYWHGIRATGVDQVAAAADVAPATLYRLFGSKDGLVAAYVEREGRGYRRWFDAAVAAGGSDPREQILSVFDALIEQVHPDRCRGCPFQMTLAETPDPANAAHRHAVATKTWVRRRFGELTQAMDPGAGSDALATQLALIMEGVYVSVQAFRSDAPAREARALAERITRPRA
jgi:AcrR family transcriptional regulator